MHYANPQTRAAAGLKGLTEAERAFYAEALRHFERNEDWMTFHGFAFGAGSPLYSGGRSHRDVVRLSLFKALEDLWLELGVRQGQVAPAQASPRGRKERAHA